jgi:hypothetical protein
MNHRHKVVAIVLTGTAMVGAVIWRTWKQSPERRDSFALGNGATISTSTPAVTYPSTRPSVSRGRKAATREDFLASLNHQPIEFYGRVVDQFDAPVAGAEIRAQVIYNTGSSSGVTKRTLITDSGGNFALVGVEGRTLDFNIVKVGYDFIPQKDAYDYTALVPEHKRHHPDPNKPVVLQMWKLQGGEPLIEKHNLAKLISDGRAYRFDLVKGSIVPSGGDLIVHLYHDHQSPGTRVERYDWKVELIAVDGGLKEENQRVAHMYLAPSEGYTERFTIDKPARSADWSRAYTANFFAKVRTNLYARLSFDVHTIPTGDGSYVNLTWWLNPNPGSRNLEGPAPKD